MNMHRDQKIPGPHQAARRAFNSHSKEQYAESGGPPSGKYEKVLSTANDSCLRSQHNMNSALLIIVADIITRVKIDIQDPGDSE